MILTNNSITDFRSIVNGKTHIFLLFPEKIAKSKEGTVRFCEASVRGVKNNMTETKEKRGTEEEELSRTKDFLCGYQLCLDMLNLRRYERLRAPRFSEECDCGDILSGNEAFWRARMFEVKTVLGQMRNGKEKLLLYYHYIRGESIEHAANMLGVSRRTGYRLHTRGLHSVAMLLRRF